MRNIIFIIDTLQTGGAEISLYNLLVRFKNYKPVVVCLYKRESQLRALFDGAGIQVVDLNLSSNFFLLFRVGAHIETLKNLNPAIIHSTLFRSDLFARMISVHLNVMVINSLVNNSYCLRRYRMEPLGRKFKLWLYQLIDLITVHRTYFFISNSESIAKSYFSSLLIDESKIRVLYRGRKIISLHEIAKYSKGLLHRGVIESEPLTFLNISRLLKRKEHRTLIVAFSEYLKTNPNSRLIICGEGPERKSLGKIINSLKLEDKILVVDNVLSTQEYFESSDFFVFPSLFEGLPGVLIEAMFSRLPIIASDIPENKECVDEHMAVFHKPGDPNDLAKAMLRATHMTDWSTRTEKAYQKAVEQFDIQKIALQYEETYTELLQKFKK